jgi:hypothetical protein
MRGDGVAKRRQHNHEGHEVPKDTKKTGVRSEVFFVIFVIFVNFVVPQAAVSEWGDQAVG